MSIVELNVGKAALVLYYALVSAHFWFACYYDWNYVIIPTDESVENSLFGKVKKLKYLTFWNALLQAFFFTLCAVAELFHRKHVQTRLNDITSVKNWVFTSLAFPMSMFVGLTFWGLYAVDRELIFPLMLEKYFPNWLNHAMHTNIVVFAFIELIASFRRYPSRKRGIGILVAFMATYLIWLLYIYMNSGIWVYPVFNVLNLPLRIVFITVLLVLSVSLYIVGEKVNNFIWSEKLKKTKRS